MSFFSDLVNILKYRQEQRKTKKLDLLTQPLLTEFGASFHSNGETIFTFTNKGETAKNVAVIPKGDFSASASSDVIKSDERGSIRLFGYPKPLPEKLRFEIHYESKIGKPGLKKFYISPEAKKFEEEK